MSGTASLDGLDWMKWMKLRSLALLCSMASGGQALASIELLVVADAGTGYIHRFDGISRSYFGSFGAGEVTSGSEIAVDPSTNTCYLYSASRVFKYNYNTGEYKGSLSLNGIGVQFGNDGSLYTWSSTTIRRYSATGALQNSWSPPAGYSWTTNGTLADNGYFYTHAFNGTTGDDAIARINVSTGAVTLDTGLSDTSQQVSGFSSSGNTVYFRLLFGGAVFSTAYVYTASGTLNTLFDNSALATVQNPGLDTAPSHNGRYFVAGLVSTDPTKGRVTLVEGQISHTIRYSFGETILQNPVSMASVVAPEPGTAIAMVIAGIGFLVHRRNNTGA